MSMLSFSKINPPSHFDSIAHSPSRTEAEEIKIVVMGMTGTGKTTFINKAAGTNLPVELGLSSCTSNVQKASLLLDGRLVTLIDTPGFNDTTMSETEVLQKIVLYLTQIHGTAQGKIHGVLYLVRISDNRMGGLELLTGRLIMKMCGDETLKNITIVTNMWGKVDEGEGNRHYSELENKFFKNALDNGASMVRHDNSVESARDIVRVICTNHPVTLRIQREIVDEGIAFGDTSAGKELKSGLEEKIEKQDKEIEMLKQEYMKAILKDEEIKQEKKRIEEALAALRNEHDTISSRFDEMKEQTRSIEYDGFAVISTVSTSTFSTNFLEE